MSAIEDIVFQFTDSLKIARSAISTSRVWEDGNGGWWLAEKSGIRELDAADDEDGWLIVALEAISLAGKLSTSEGHSYVQTDAGMRKLYRIRQDLSMWED